MDQAPRPLLAVHAVVPALFVLAARGTALGPFSHDLVGHLWVYWNASQGPATRTTMLAHPEGIDLLPYLGGWTDIAIGSIVAPLAGLELAYDAVAFLYLVIAGVGGHALARTLGSTHRSAVLAGALLQVDGFVLFHLHGGRAEQLGIGFVALALAAALRAWRSSDVRWAVAAGAAGAATVYTSWQLAVFLAGCATFMAPFVVWSGRPPGAFRRWATAAGLTAALAGPWAAVFLVRAFEAGKFADEAGQPIAFSAWGAQGVVGWLALGAPRASWLAMATLLTVWWTTRRRDERVWLGVVLGCVLAVVLSWGPHPAWFGPGRPDSGSWGPFQLVQSVPVLRGFVWPDRFLAVLGLASAPAAALLLDRVGAWARRHGLPASVALVFGGLLVADGLFEAWWVDRLPGRGYEIPNTPPLRALRDLPEPGAVLDLPRPRDAATAMRYQAAQTVHERPILFAMPLHVAIDRRIDAVAARDPLIRWAATLRGPGATPARFEPDSLRDLREMGYGFVALHADELAPDKARLAREVLSESLGTPVLAEPDGSWMVWRLTPSDRP